MRVWVTVLLLALSCGCGGCGSGRRYLLEVALPTDARSTGASYEEVLSYLASDSPAQEVLQSVARAAQSHGLEPQPIRHPYVSSIFGTSAMLARYASQRLGPATLWPHQSHLEASAWMFVAFHPDLHQLSVGIGAEGDDALAEELYRQLHEAFVARFGAEKVKSYEN